MDEEFDKYIMAQYEEYHWCKVYTILKRRTWEGCADLVPDKNINNKEIEDDRRIF